MRMGAIKKCILVLLSLLLAIPAVSFAALDEKEPNDYLLNARNMTSQTWYSGRAKSSTDMDWFYFNATGKQIALNSTMTNLNATIFLLNNDKELLDSWYFDAGGSSVSLNATYDLKNTGPHFLLFSPTSIYDNFTQLYMLRVEGDIDPSPGDPTSLSDAKLETESNDKWYDADQIRARSGKNISYKYAGNIKGSDEDWFRFKVDHKTDLILEEFKILQTGSQNSTWNIKIYNDGIELPENKKNNNNEDDIVVGYWDEDQNPGNRMIRIPSKGMYYLRVYECSTDHYRNLVLNGTGLSDAELPLADAGKDRTILEDKKEFVLNATKSTGKNSLNYKWEKVELLSSPNSTINLKDANQTLASFNVPDVVHPEEKFTFELTVKDAINGLTDKDRVTVTIEDTYDGGGSSDGGIGCNYHPDADFGWGWFTMLICLAALPWIRKKITG